MLKVKRKEKEDVQVKLIDIIHVQSKNVKNLMGSHYLTIFLIFFNVNRSEGSLNQHVKNKHPELANHPEFKINILKNNNEGSPKTKAELSKFIKFF